MSQTHPYCIITKKGTKSAYTTILEAIGLLLLDTLMIGARRKVSKRAFQAQRPRFTPRPGHMWRLKSNILLKPVQVPTVMNGPKHG